MMFSMEKCSGRSGTGTSEESELYAGGGEGMGKEGVPSDEVASAVAAVSDEIGDILKDELGDADRADRIGAELADLSAELGLLAGLADGDTQPDFASRFEVPFEWIAMGHRGSGSGSSSSSWSGARGGRARRPARPKRAPRRRPITKGKECVRRASGGRAAGAARRGAGGAESRARRAAAGPPSDASDVGADSDTTDQWTELDDATGSSDSSSMKEAAAVDEACNGYQHKSPQPEAPAMGQFLLPLLSSDPAGAEPEHFLIRHEDILQLLASAEEGNRDEIPLDDDAELDAQPDTLSSSDAHAWDDEQPVTAEDEAALIHYAVAAGRKAGEQAEQFAPMEEWLLGVYHSWCEISALMYTLIGTNMSVEMVTEEWVYRARFGCHCRLCLCLANNAPALAALVRLVVTALAHGGSTMKAATGIVRALGLGEDGSVGSFTEWDLARLQRIRFSDEGAAIIHEQLSRLAQESDVTSQIVSKICLCRGFDRPFEKQYAVERFCKILENFKAASTITFKVEMIPVDARAREGAGGWVDACVKRLARYLAPHQRCSTAERLRDMMARTTPIDLSAWSGYKHRCDCLTPRTLCALQRKQLLRISFFGMMQAVNEFNGAKPGSTTAADKPPNEVREETAGRELQQGDGTGAKPPDSEETVVTGAAGDKDPADCRNTDPDDITDSDANSGTASLGLSTSSSLDSASELLLAAAAAVESGGSEGETAPGELCRTVRHLMRSIASIERLMDRVLKHCDEWPAPASRNDHEARKRVDMGLSEVDRKLMAMYRRLPEVHRRQLQVYRKQKKLSTVCMQLVGGRAPPPPPPGSPPPAPHQPARALCPEYHLQRFREVRRKVMHMRDQQLYYHRLRMWLEDQLRQERESLPETNVTLVEDLPRRKRRTASPKVPRLITSGPKHKIKPVSSSISKPRKILQLLKNKAPAQTTELLTKDLKNDEDRSLKPEVEPPEAFPLERDDNVSDTETIVGEKESGDLCKEMKECLAKFANFALNSPDNNLQDEYNMQVDSDTKYPESVSPPLQEMSPTTSEPIPVYTPKPNQRLLAVNKFLNRNNVDFKDDKVIDFQSQITPEVLNVPLNARRMPLLVKEENEKDVKITETADNPEVVVDTGKDPTIYKYVTFGIEIKKAMEECQNIINSYDSSNKEKDEKDREEENDGNPTLEQICEVMMSLDKNSAEFLDKIDDEAIDMDTANTKLAELVENMPQILANMPEIASKLSEFANASFELPEFASIMNSLPDVNNEAQLTPETLKQIRELKLNKCRDNVKVTKNTAKRKTNRRFKNNVDNSDIIGTMTFELDSKDISELLKDEKELQALMKNKSNNKEDFKDLLFSISAQVVINKVFEYVKQNKSPELAKYLEEDKDLFSLPKHSINSEMYSKASTLFDNSVKDALSMDELRELVKSRFNSWKHYVATKFKSIPIELLENEIEAMLDKFYSYIQDLAGKQCVNDSDKIIEKIDELRKNKNAKDSDSDGCAASKESLKQITKLLSTSAGNTFDLLIMKLSKMSQDNKGSVKGLKFKYMDVIRRCSDSQQLAGWILLDPEIASNVIQELTGLPIKKIDNVQDFTKMTNESKKDYFIERLREMNRQYMEMLPKKALTGDEWLVILYRLEQLEDKLKDAFAKVPSPTKVTVQAQGASEAEILAAKGLSKIIGKANLRIVKKTNEPRTVNVTSDKVKEPVKEEDKKCNKNDALLAKCEAILTSKGEKSLLDSFYTIKSYITQGLPVPETYKKHVISICSSIDAKLLDEDIEETLKVEKTDSEPVDSDNKEKSPLSVIGSQNPELLAKYSAQALRNAKHTLNAVAFRNMMRNGQSKSESDACDTPKSDCKWTNDCICNTCKDTDVSNSVCLGDIVKQCYDMETKSKSGLEEKKKDVKQGKVTPVKQAKPQAKACENTTHQQHVCKVGHSANGSAACAGDAGADQPCTCCYCTVFGHAPPLTTPVPRNFNETRERLRSILNKKKLKCRTANGEPEVQEKRPAAMQPQPAEAAPAAPQPPKPKQPAQLAQPKPPALPKTLPPTLTAQAQQKRTMDLQQKQLADKMARMVVSEKTDKPKALQRTAPVQVDVPPTSAVKTEGKVNPTVMEQVRLRQQLKQQQQAQLQQQQAQIQQLQQQQAQQQAQSQAQQQKKPEPIYDLPIHNKPTLTPQQQQQIRQQQLAQQQQQQLQQQQQQQRQSRPQQQRAMSLSSRDTSVFSTSSGCDGDSCWTGSRAEDPRDLDALLQYIEGPARHVDRGKKRAKKQRQKAKKLEARLLEEHAELTEELNNLRCGLVAMHSAQAIAKRRVEEVRKTIAQHHRAKKKGKKQKLNVAQQTKMEEICEQFGELTTLLNTAAKEVQATEKQVAVCSRRLEQCEKKLSEARAMQGKAERAERAERPVMDEAALLEKRQQLQQQLQREQVQQQQQQIQRVVLEVEKQRLEWQKQAALLNVAHSAGIARVCRMPGDGSVTVTIPNQRDETPLAQLLQNNSQFTVLSVSDDRQQQKAQTDSQKKQTWEQALAHMNQLAKGSNKEKKKPKEAPPKAEPKPKEQQRSQSLPDATQALSKKQRKLLAKQQAEEEERRKLEAQEAKAKKAEAAKKQEAAKQEATNKKAEAAKKTEPAKKKEEKKDNKKEKTTEKKGKENKQEKTTPTPAAKQNKPPPAPAQPAKKEKKKETQHKPHVINITPDTTIEVVSKKGPCNKELEKPASCSIMEQLSCGVQVADLKLPPGITLTRVQPTEKKEAPSIKSVPLWKCNQLPAAPTPVARPPPVINADPSVMMFTTAQPMPPEAPKLILQPEPAAPAQPVGKSKKAKKKAKKAAAAAESDTKPDGTKMVTLRNPMFHPNLPPVQVSNTPVQKKAEQIRIPDPIPMPPNACQATITPTSNGMYTIRNPLMSMMHQQSLMGIRNPTPQMNPMYGQPQFNYVNPNVYTPVPNVPPQTYVLDPSRSSPKNDSEFQNRIMNLASFTQKNDEGYSLFKTSEDSQQRNFLAPEYFDNQSPKPTVSPNPIGTRPSNESNRSFDSNDSSLFANPIQRPEPIGTPLKREEERSDYSSLYTPFGQEDKNVFRNALFSDKNESNMGKMDDLGQNHIGNGDPLPYFQRLRVGSKLNNEVTIHHVKESKFYKGQDTPHQPVELAPQRQDESLFSRPNPPTSNTWPEGLYTPVGAGVNTNTGAASSRSSPGPAAGECGELGAGGAEDEAGFGAVGSRGKPRAPPTEPSVFHPDRSITNLSSLEVSEREIESFKRFDFYFEPPQHKPKVRLDLRDIAAALRHNQK